MKYTLKESVEKESKISLSYQGINIVVEEELVRFCKKPGFLNNMVYLIFKNYIFTGITAEKRIKSVIRFLKDVLDYSFSKIKKRGINVEKIKKTFNKLILTIPKDKNDERAGFYQRSDNNITLLIHGEGHFDKKENKENEDQEDEFDYESTVMSYSKTFIHEIGHAIQEKLLPGDAARYWQEGWLNFSKNIRSAYINADLKIDKKEIAENLKQESINEILEKFKNYMQEEFKKSSNNLEKLELFKIYKEFIKKNEKGYILASIFENKELNIFKNDFIHFYITQSSQSGQKIFYPLSFSDLGKLYVLCMCSPESFLRNDNSNFINTFSIYQNDLNEFKQKLGLQNNTTRENLENILCKKVFISPFSLGYDPLKRINTNSIFDYNIEDNDNYENNKHVEYLNIPTKYGESTFKEDWAESFSFYILYPERLSNTAYDRVKRVLSLSKFYGQKLEEKLLRKLIRIILS
jgi:hypothetical protein